MPKKKKYLPKVFLSHTILLLLWLIYIKHYTSNMDLFT